MKKAIGIGMSLAMILSLTACSGSSSAKEEPAKQEETKEETATEPVKEESPYYFKDLEVVTKDYTMKITDWKIIQPGEEGNEYSSDPVIAFWYSTTNTSGKEINPMTAWITIMTAVQDNNPNMINKLNVASLPDSSFLDSQMATIKKDGTVDNAMAYILTDAETPVELTATEGIVGDELGGMTFDIVAHEASNGTAATVGTAENTQKVESSFKDNVIVTKDYTIEITDWRIIQPGEEGNEYSSDPVIAFWYTTTNTSGKDINPTMAWIGVIEAVQDNDPNKVNKLNVGSLPDSNYLDSQLASIKAGGSVENAVSYTLTDLETPVVLTATDGMFGKNLGSQQFDIK